MKNIIITPVENGQSYLVKLPGDKNSRVITGPIKLVGYDLHKITLHDLNSDEGAGIIIDHRSKPDDDPDAIVRKIEDYLASTEELLATLHLYSKWEVK